MIRYKIILLLIPLLLTGCYDSTEMEDRNYIITMGIDKSDSNNLYTVSLGAADLSALASKGEEGETAKPAAITVTGDSLAAAIRRADAYSSTKIYLGQLKTVAFGSTLISDKALMSSVLDELERSHDISPNVIILGIEGEASQLVEAILAENDTTGLFIWNFFKNTAQDVAVTEAVHLEAFLKDLRQSGGQGIIPKINLENEKLRLGGGMAMADYAYIGSLRDAAQRGYLIMQGNGEGAVYEAERDNTVIPMWLYKNNSKIWFSDQADRLICHIKVTGEGSIAGSNILNDSIFEVDTIKELEKIFEKNIKQEIENTIKLARQDFNSDIFIWASKLKRQNGDLYNKYWHQSGRIPKDMVVDIEVDLKIKTIGVIE